MSNFLKSATKLPSAYAQPQTFFLTLILLLFFCTASYSGDDFKDLQYVPLDPESQTPLQTSPPPPLQLARRRSSLLEAYTINSDFGTQLSSLQTYGTPEEYLSVHEAAMIWDAPPKFAFALDTNFFVQPDTKIIMFALLAAVLGIVPSSPSCGYLMHNVANFTHIPDPNAPGANPAYSRAAIAWITVSTAPAFIMTWYLAGKEVGKKLFQKQHFTPSRDISDNQPHVLDTNMLHKTLIAFCTCSAAICAAVPTALMYASEKEFPVFFAITAAPFYLTWAGTYWNETSLGLDQFFQKHFYRSQATRYKKETLLQKINAFKGVFKTADDNFIRKVFSYVKKGPEQKFFAEDPFIFSLFFVKSQRRADPSTAQGSAPLLNFRMDMENVRLYESAAYISILIAGAGTYANFYIKQYVLKNAFLSMGLRERDADSASTALSAFEAPFRTALMTGVQTRFLQELPKAFSSKHMSNYPCIRKTAGMIASMNGVLFALPMVVAGMEVYKGSSVAGKFFHIFPAFLNDFAFYEQMFNTNTNHFLTHMLTLRSKNIKSVERMKTFLSYYADEASQLLENFDDATVDEIYSRTQEGT